MHQTLDDFGNILPPYSRGYQEAWLGIITNPYYEEEDKAEWQEGNDDGYTDSIVGYFIEDELS